MLKNSEDLEITINDCESKLQDEVENRNSLQIHLATSTDRSSIRAVTQQLDFSNKKIELIALELIKLFKRQMTLKKTLFHMQEFQESLPKPLPSVGLPSSASSISITDYSELQKKLTESESALQKVTSLNSEIKSKNENLELEIDSLKSQLKTIQESSTSIGTRSFFSSENKNVGNPNDGRLSVQSLKVDNLIPELNFLSQQTYTSPNLSLKELPDIPSSNLSFIKDTNFENVPNDLIPIADSLLIPTTFHSQRASFLKNNLHSQCQTHLGQLQDNIVVWIQCIVHLKYYRDKLQATPKMDLDLPLSILLSMLYVIIDKVIPVFKGEVYDNCKGVISDILKEQAKKDPLSIRPPQEEAKDILTLKQQYNKLKKDHEALLYYNEKNEEIIKDFKLKYEPEGQSKSIDSSSLSKDAMDKEEIEAKVNEMNDKIKTIEQEKMKMESTLFELQNEVNRRDRALLQLEADLNESKERFNVLLKFTEDQKKEFNILINQLKEEVDKLADENENLQEKLTEYEEVDSRGSINSYSPTAEVLSPVNQVFPRNSNTLQEESPDLIPDIVSPPDIILNERYEKLQTELDDKLALIAALDKRLKSTELDLRKKERKIRHLENRLKQNGINYVTNLDTSIVLNPETPFSRPESILSEFSEDDDSTNLFGNDSPTLQSHIMSAINHRNPDHARHEQELSTPRSSAIVSTSSKLAFDDILYQLQVESQSEKDGSGAKTFGTDMKPPMKVQEISSSAKEMQSPQTEIEYFSNSMKENSLEEQVSALNENAKSLEEAVQKLGIEKMEFVRIQEELIQEKFTLISELNTIRSQKEDLEAQLHSYEELIEHQPKELLSTPEISTRTISHPLPTDALLDSPNTISKGIKQNSSYDNLLQEAEELRKKLDLAHESQQRLENFEKENNEKALICEAQEFKIQSLSHLLEEQTKSLSENNLKIKSLESNLSEYEPFKELYILSQNALYLAKDQVDSLQLEKQKLMGVIEELHIELNIAQMDVEALRLQENLPNVSIEQTAEEKRDSWIVALNTVEIDSSKEIEKLKKEMEDMKKKLDYTNGLLEQAEARSSQVVTLLETLKSKSIELTNLEAELANLKSGKLTTTNREIPIDELPENMKETSVVSNEMELKIQDLIMEKDAALEKLELKIVELEQDKHDLLKKLETLELELQDSNFTRENLDNKLKTKEEGFISTITKEQEIHTILSSELETTKKQYKDLEVELERLRFQNHNDLKRSSAYNELLAKCINLEMITESIKKENTTLMENLKQVEESLMSKEEKERANEPFLAEANAKILNFEHQIEENQRIIEELISFKANHQETLSLVEDLQNQSRESNIRIKELSDQLEVALSVKESLRQELEGLSEMLHTVLKEVQGPQEDSEIFKSTNISDQSKLSALGSICHELRQKLASAYEEVETKNEAFNSVEKQLDYALAAKENAQMELMKLSEQLEVLQKEKENSISAVSTSRFLDNDKDKNGGMSLNISGNEFISPHFEASEQREKNPIIFSPSAASLSNDPSQHYLTPEDEFQMKEGQTNVVSLEKEIDDLRMRIAATVDYEYKHTLLCTLLARSRGLEPNNPFQDDKKESLHLPVKRISTFEPMPFSHSIPSLEAFLPSPEYLSEQNHDPVIEKTADLQNRAQLLYASCQDTLESIKKHMEDLEERTEEVQKKEKALEAMVSKFVMLRTTLQQHQSRLQPNVHNPSPSISSSNGSDDFLIAKKGNEPLETEKSFDSDADTESLYHDSLSSRDKTIQSILSGALSQEIQPTSDLIAEIQSKILSTQRKSNEVTSFNQSYEKEYIEVKEKIQKKLNSLSKNSTNDSEQRTLSEWIEVYDQELQNTWEEERMKLMHASEKTIELLTSDFEDQERVLLGRLKSQKALVLQLQEEKALLTDNLSTLEAECEKLQVLFEKCEDEAEEREEELLTELAKANMNHKLSEKETHELKSEIQSLRNNLQELEQKSKPLTMNETELEREYKKLEEKLLHYDDQMNEIMQKNMELVMQLSQYK